MVQLKTVMTIGGSDPMCGAGIQADILAISSLGCHPLSVITAVTSQNSKGVNEVWSLLPKQILNQIKAINDDVRPDAIKIGMVGSLENAFEIAEYLSLRPVGIPTVVDPVIKASAGGTLLSKKENKEKLAELYLREIIPFATLFTPNLPEAQELAILIDNKVSINSTKDEIAEILLNGTKCKALIIKGGHGKERDVEDVLYIREGKEFIRKSVRHERINCFNLHGTGCVFSSLMASFLALGESIEDAFKKTSSKMIEIIRESIGYKLGVSDYGPLNINNYKI